MEKKNILLVALLLAGGYFLWKKSQKSTTVSDMGSGEPVSPTSPKSQKDCPQGTVFQPMECLVAPCEGGVCVEEKFPLPPVGCPPFCALPPNPSPMPKNPILMSTDTQISFSGSEGNTVALQQLKNLVRQSNFN